MVKPSTHCLTVLFPIVQNDNWTIEGLFDCMILPLYCIENCRITLDPANVEYLTLTKPMVPIAVHTGPPAPNMCYIYWAPLCFELES